MQMQERISEKGADLSQSDRWAYGHQTHASARSVSQIEAEFLKSLRFYRGLLKHHLPDDLNACILDLPCGEGQMVFVLREMGYENVSGCDLDTSRLATGQKLGLPIYTGNVFTELEQRQDNSVDCVFAMDFVEHLDKDDVIRFLQLAFHKLSPRGKLFVRTPCADALHGAAHVFNDFTHKWAATSGVLRQLLNASGFISVNVFGEHPTFDMRFGYIRVPLFQIMSRMLNLVVRCVHGARYVIWSASMWGVGMKPASNVDGKKTVAP